MRSRSATPDAAGGPGATPPAADGSAAPASGEAAGPARKGRAAAVTQALRTHPLVTAAVFLGLLARLLYWQITERRFEDGLITVVHAVNAADGIGLTHHPYEPVTHGFTSPVSVVTPLVGEVIGNVWGYVDGFLALRTTGRVAFVLAVVFADRICRRLGVATLPRAFVLVFLAVDYNHVMYGMAGMETQIAVCVLLATVDALMRRAVKTTGVLCGVCLLTRPEFALFIGPALLALLLWDRRAGIRAGLLTGAVLAPWVMFTTLYYGSPVPNTIEAKSLRYHVELPDTLAPGTWADFVSTRVAERADSTWHQLTPFLSNGFVTGAPLLPFLSAAIATVVMLLAGTGAVATRRNRAWWPVLAFVGLFILYRFATLPEGYYEWYYPPITALVMICAAVGLTRLRTLAPRTSGAAAIGLAALFAWPLPYMIALDSRLQHDIEDRVREPMAEWLRANVPPGQAVTSESAGYVGYFGKVRLWDYPGLTSQEALGFLRELGWRRNSMEALIARARPQFVVYRPDELEGFRQERPEAARLYTEVARFGVPFERSRLELGGVAMVNIDREFVILRRTG